MCAHTDVAAYSAASPFAHTKSLNVFLVCTRSTSVYMCVCARVYPPFSIFPSHSLLRSVHFEKLRRLIEWRRWTWNGEKKKTKMLVNKNVHVQLRIEHRKHGDLNFWMTSCPDADVYTNSRWERNVYIRIFFLLYFLYNIIYWLRTNDLLCVLDVVRDQQKAIHSWMARKLASALARRPTWMLCTN